MRKRLLLVGTILLSTSLTAASALAAHHEDKGKRFGKKDADGDGTISKAEWMEFSEMRFTELDTDGDGSVSKAEWSAKKKAMREQKKSKGGGY